MLSLMADYQLYGLHAGGYHLTNVLLHTASVILLFLVLRQMTGALWRSAFVAAVFAIHPLRVESVAWVAERKDVLGAFFFMLTLGAYARYVRKPNSLARYLMVVICFVLALAVQADGGNTAVCVVASGLLAFAPVRTDGASPSSGLFWDPPAADSGKDSPAGADSRGVRDHCPGDGKTHRRQRPRFHVFARRRCIGLLCRLSAPDGLAGRIGDALSLSAPRPAVMGSGAGRDAAGRPFRNRMGRAANAAMVADRLALVFGNVDADDAALCKQAHSHMRIDTPICRKSEFTWR